MAIYSHSKLSAFEQCPLKYKFKYIEKIRPEIEQTIEGFLGSTVHKTLEWLYIEIKNGNQPDLDRVIDFFINLWNNEFKKEIKIVNEQHDAEYYFNQGIRFIIDYFLAHSPFKDNTIKIEHKILVKLDEEGRYLVQGYIDRLVHNKETNIFEIHDYKTSNFLKTQEELDKDRQLALYSLGVKDSYPEAAEVHLIWHFLAHNKKMTSKRTENELQKLKQDIISLIERIESAKEYPASPSCLCNWCEYKNLCEKMKNQ